MPDRILVRYGELSLKKSNRKQFVTKINQHIKHVLSIFSNITYKSEGMRFYIILNGNNPDDIIPLLKQIPGIHSFSIVSRSNNILEDIKACAKDVLDNSLKKEKTKIKVETNRADKTFPLTSLEISKHVSGYLFKNISGIEADVHNPEITVYIDVRLEGTFIFTDIIPGMGGFPSGSMGKVLLMISGGIDSIVSGYLAIKKGMDIEAVHYASPPYTSLNALQKVVDLLEVLLPYTSTQSIKLHVIPFTTLQDAIYSNVREDYGITIMRRMMYRIGMEIALKHNCLAIVNGENIGQVASQTLESINVINNVTSFPIIRPLATYDKQDIIDISVKIKTYDISIRPYEDCCTVFVPRHPQIKPRLDEVLKQETKFDYQSEILNAIQNTKTIVLRIHSHTNVTGVEEIF